MMWELSVAFFIASATPETELFSFGSNYILKTSSRLRSFEFSVITLNWGLSTSIERKKTGLGNVELKFMVLLYKLEAPTNV